MALVFGELISFEDKKMDLEYGNIGYWQPLTFLQEVGARIYFMESYNPKKTPVLFLHGAVGTPLHFKDIAGRIDRKRYQPWLFYYPSGMPLEKISTALNIMVMDLHQLHRFEKLYVVAHSMGGLAEAQRISGYDESHVGILSSQRVLDDISRLLEGSQIWREYNIRYFGITK